MRRSAIVTGLCVLAHVIGAARLRAQGGTVAEPARRTSATPVEIGPAHLFPYRTGVDVQHYDVTVRLPSSGGRIAATSVITLRRDTSLDTLVLDLVGMTVDGVTVAGRARPFRQDSAMVRVPLRTSDGVRVRIGIRYHGTPSDGLIVREDSVRGWSAFGDNWPNRARFWLPTVDHPSDKATVAWTVTAPRQLTVVANGEPLGRVLTAARRGRASAATWRFRLDQPIPPHLMVIGVADMQETPLGATACGAVAVTSANRRGCVPQSVWTFPSETSFAPGPFAEAGRIVEFFARLVGPYPYSRLAHLQSATRFGGMENATAIFYSDNAFRNRSLGVPLVAHETAHQWFGNAVTPRGWPDLWLSEGFASYLTPLYLRATRGDSAFRAEMTRIREEILAAAVVAERPVVDSVGAMAPLTLLNANSYQKGAFVLHMLRAHVGDSAFVRALREYQRRYRHATATTDELRTLMEQQHGQSLAPFFVQWLRRPGWAELTIRWRHDPATAQLVLDVTQSPRFAPFELPLTVVVRDPGGQGTPVRLEIAARTGQTLTVPVRGVVAAIDVDPDVLLLGRVQLVRAAER